MFSRCISNQYFHFKAGYPDSSEGKSACIAADSNAYMHEWSNENCEIRRPFACEVIASSNPTTVAPPTPTPDTPCRSDSPNDGWIKHTADDGGDGDWCFKFSSEYVDWVGAKTNCEYDGGRLASIHSEQENTFITRKMAMNGLYTISWVGLQRDSLTGQFVWIDDGKNPDFAAWGDGGMISFLILAKFKKM